jgi:glutamate-1-semialdehyde aminotransferase
MAPDIEKNVLMLPFNDTEQSGRIIEANKERLAAVFLEPMTIFGGAIPQIRSSFRR